MGISLTFEVIYLNVWNNIPQTLFSHSVNARAYRQTMGITDINNFATFTLEGAYMYV